MHTDDIIFLHTVDKNFSLNKFYVFSSMVLSTHQICEYTEGIIWHMSEEKNTEFKNKVKKDEWR